MMALIPLLGLIALLAFVLVRLAPGGPFDRDRSPVSPEVERALQERYHLDESVVAQFVRFLKGCLVGDLGPSLKYRNHTVAEILAAGIPVSAVLGGLSFLYALGVGIPLGFVSAVGRRAWGDWLAGTLSLLAVCVPGFVAGPLLVMLFGVRLGWFPVALWGGIEHLVLPVITLGTYFAGRVARLVREGMTETLRLDFVRTARAKGVGEMGVLFRHAFPLAAMPLLSYSGPLLADLLTGSFVVENLFQLPGIGTLTVNGALNRDYPLIVGLVLLYAGLLLVLNVVVDVVQVWVDPRLRHA